MRRLLSGLLLLGALASGGARADQFVQDGEFTVHYAALATVDLAPEVARGFGIARSRHRALLTLNAQRRGGDRTASVPATAKGTARSLLGHVQTLELRPAREGETHYVLAEFEALDQEWLNFEVAVLPEGASRPLTVKFKQQFYTD
ncbi:MAG: DUF4426 domain-containing protein [Gammaproteobacteria bacterium]|nr:DUF4426 domain-containing protein [Gammaproteobacteria bacterium]